MRGPSWSFVPTAECGVSRVAPSHHSVLRAPPPPRFVGLYMSLVWAWATPAEANIWAARGAVSPKPTIIWTKPRRLRRPDLTSLINAFSSRSSMRILHDVREAQPRGVLTLSGRSTVTGWWRLYKL